MAEKPCQSIEEDDVDVESVVVVDETPNITVTDITYASGRRIRHICFSGCSVDDNSYFPVTGPEI